MQLQKWFPTFSKLWQRGSSPEVSFAETKPEIGEFATFLNDPFRFDRLSQVLEPQDEILRSKRQGLTIYSVFEKVAEDDQVHSCIQQRILAARSKEWSITPGDDRDVSVRAAEELERQIKAIGWDNIYEKAWWAVFFGNSCGEIIWQPGSSATELGAIKFKRQGRFVIGREGEVRMLTPDNLFDGVPVPDHKFWWLSTGGYHDEDPYGLGLAHYLYWPVLFKKSGVKFWLTFADQFGNPTKVGYYPPGASESDKIKLKRALAAISQDTGILLAEGMRVGLLEATRTGSSDLYERLHEAMNSAIAKIILSQTMTTDNGSSLAQGKVHEAVKDEVVKADGDFTCDQFNKTIVPWWLLFNPQFAQASPPAIWYDFTEQPDLKAQAERDQIIVGWGYQPKPEYIRETYGDNWILPEPSDNEQPSLNGVQINSLLEILDKAKDYPQDKQQAILRLAFPQLTDEQLANLLIEPEPAEPTEPEPEPSQLTEPEPMPQNQPLVNLSDPLPGESLAFVEATPSTVDAFIAQLRVKAQPEFAKMIGQVRQALSESEDLVQFREKIDAIYPDLNGEALTALMAEAMFASRLAGIFESEQEAEI